MVPAESKKTTDYVDRLLTELNKMISSGEKDLKRVILKKEAPRFHYSVNDKMYLEIKTGAELYIMSSKEVKEGKAYVFTPWHWNSGKIFLVLEDYLEELEPN